MVGYRGIVVFLLVAGLQRAYSLDGDLYEKAHFDIEDEESYTVEESEDAITYTVPSGKGKVEVVCSVKNTDFASQCQAEWEKHSKKDSEKKKDSHSPKAEFKMSWSSEDSQEGEE